MSKYVEWEVRNGLMEKYKRDPDAMWVVDLACLGIVLMACCLLAFC